MIWRQLQRMKRAARLEENAEKRPALNTAMLGVGLGVTEARYDAEPSREGGVNCSHCATLLLHASMPGGRSFLEWKQARKAQQTAA